MLSYYLVCRKNTESKSLKVAKTNKWKATLLPNVQCLIVKNQDLLKSEYLVDY